MPIDEIILPANPELAARESVDNFFSSINFLGSIGLAVFDDRDAELVRNRVELLNVEDSPIMIVDSIRRQLGADEAVSGTIPNITKDYVDAQSTAVAEDLRSELSTLGVDYRTWTSSASNTGVDGLGRRSIVVLNDDGSSESYLIGQTEITSIRALADYWKTHIFSEYRVHSGILQFSKMPSLENKDLTPEEISEIHRRAMRLGKTISSLSGMRGYPVSESELARPEFKRVQDKVRPLVERKARLDAFRNDFNTFIIPS